MKEDKIIDKGYGTKPEEGLTLTGELNYPEVQRLKNEKIKLAKKLLKKGYTKAETHRAIIAEFKLERSLDSGFPFWLSKIDNQ